MTCIMLDLLKQHIIDRLGKEVPNVDEVLGHFKPIRVRRNTILLRHGEVCKHVWFIAKGCVQVFVYDAEANEMTRDIVLENNWVSELISFGNRQPATENIRTVEPCELLAIDREGFQKMMETVPQFEVVYRQILEASYANSVYRLNTFVALSALDRVRWLMEYRPKLLTRLSNKLVASCLGISQETLSRLKSKL